MPSNIKEEWARSEFIQLLPPEIRYQLMLWHYLCQDVSRKKEQLGEIERWNKYHWKEPGLLRSSWLFDIVVSARYRNTNVGISRFVERSLNSFNWIWTKFSVGINTDVSHSPKIDRHPVQLDVLTSRSKRRHLCILVVLHEEVLLGTKSSCVIHTVARTKFSLLQIITPHFDLFLPASKKLIYCPHRNHGQREQREGIV